MTLEGKGSQLLRDKWLQPVKKNLKKTNKLINNVGVTLGVINHPLALSGRFLAAAALTSKEGLVP